MREREEKREGKGQGGRGYTKGIKRIALFWLCVCHDPQQPLALLVRFPSLFSSLCFFVVCCFLSLSFFFLVLFLFFRFPSFLSFLPFLLTPLPFLLPFLSFLSFLLPFHPSTSWISSSVCLHLPLSYSPIPPCLSSVSWLICSKRNTKQRQSCIRSSFFSFTCRPPSPLPILQATFISPLSLLLYPPLSSVVTILDILLSYIHTHIHSLTYTLFSTPQPYPLSSSIPTLPINPSLLPLPFFFCPAQRSLAETYLFTLCNCRNQELLFWHPAIEHWENKVSDTSVIYGAWGDAFVVSAQLGRKKKRREESGAKCDLQGSWLNVPYPVIYLHSVFSIVLVSSTFLSRILCPLSLAYHVIYHITLSDRNFQCLTVLMELNTFCLRSVRQPLVPGSWAAGFYC